MKYEQISKHEALLKATEMAGGNAKSTMGKICVYSDRFDPPNPDV